MRSWKKMLNDKKGDSSIIRTLLHTRILVILKTYGGARCPLSHKHTPVAEVAADDTNMTGTLADGQG